jgi:enoyl-CoA hydratase
MFPAKRALELGMINRVVPAGEALAEAKKLAATIAANGPLAVLASKRVSVESQDWSTAEMWDKQAKLTEHVFSSEDAREGSAAFAEKRAPVWRGR